MVGGSFRAAQSFKNREQENWSYLDGEIPAYLGMNMRFAASFFVLAASEPCMVVVRGDKCLPNQAPLSQSPSCNEGASLKLATDTCCPTCCKNATGFCEPTCDVERCLSPSSPTQLWSQAYTNDARLSFMLVMQRPFAWDVPTACSCGSQVAPLIHLSGEPIMETHPHRVQPGFEESSLRLRQKERDQHGCCTPPKNYEFYTRNLRCTFALPCGERFIELAGGQAFEQAAVQVVPRMGTQGGGALVCAPRLTRKLAAAHLASGYLGEWFSHYASRDAKVAILYSGDCLADVLTPSVLAKEAKGLQVIVVDLSSTREVPAWYHSQVLTMRDCWARGVSGGAAWSASFDMDELLAVPPGWSAAPAFATAHAIRCAPSHRDVKIRSLQL